MSDLFGTKGLRNQQSSCKFTQTTPNMTAAPYPHSGTFWINLIKIGINYICNTVPIEHDIYM
jgi:hypothetical protein